MVNRRIQKSDISSPTPISVPRNLTEISNDALFRLNDASVSSPNLTRIAGSLTIRQYSSLIQGLVAFKRQILALASASQSLVRELQEVIDVTSPNVETLNFFADSVQLLSNAFTDFGTSLERDVELPFLADFKELSHTGKSIQENNKKKIDTLMRMLQKEEDIFYKMGKKKQSNFETYHDSLNQRMAISNEISRLQKENESLMDDLTSKRWENIVSIASGGIRSELEAFALIHEGLTKLSSSLDLKFNPLTASETLDNF